LVALYPPEGTFYSDNPYIVLNAPWVRPEQRRAAEVFQRWLAGELTAKRAGAEGFRPADLADRPAGRVTKANGADPAQPKRVLGLPEPRVLDSIKKTWRQDRKPANVELVLDVSGSMSQENRLARAQQGLEAFFREVSPNDRVGLTIFSDRIQRLVPIAPFSKNRGRLRALVRQLIADGGTAVYNATAQGLDTVRALRDRERINAVVVLTDGEDTDSTLSAQDVIQRARSQGDSRDQVRVFTIAYSAEAEGAREALTGIAKASGGQAYEGSTEDIETVYRSISSFF
jgi:Ca-activated chloride channel family protein